MRAILNFIFTSTLKFSWPVRLIFDEIFAIMWMVCMSIYWVEENDLQIDKHDDFSFNFVCVCVWRWLVYNFICVVDFKFLVDVIMNISNKNLWINSAIRSVGNTLAYLQHKHQTPHEQLTHEQLTPLTVIFDTISKQLCTQQHFRLTM